MIQQRYKPRGELRPGPGNALPTDYTFTGQKWEEGLRLMYYQSRWYDPSLGRWVQPDSIIPEPYNSLDWDRYQYAQSNPVKYIDPNGHAGKPPYDPCPIGCPVINMTGWSKFARFTVTIFLAVTVDNLTGGRTGVYGNGTWGVIPQSEYINSGAWSITPVFGGVVGGADDISKAATSLSDDLGNELGEKIFNAIEPPKYRGGLKDAMEKLGISAPQGMQNPQVHHDFPWDFRDWFAGPGRGLDVNDPQFGRWVSGSPQGPHQKWTSEYNRAWQSFIQKNPNATRQQVIDYLKILIDSGRFESQ